MCAYYATMIKTTKVSVDDHLNMCLALPYGIRQLTGKEDRKPKLTPKFALDKNWGEHTIWLIPDGDAVTVERAD
jgi:hypothetical protein